MRLAPLLAFALAACATTVPPMAVGRADRWWSDVAALADDGMEGRLTGSAGFRRAADHVVGQLEAIGLEPAGSEGWFQAMAFEEQYLDAAGSSAVLVGDGRETPVRIPDEMIVGRGDGPRPRRVDAPLVFVGYGLHMPEAGHDDFAGIDLKNRIVVFLSGGPAQVSGALKAHARRDRARLLSERGAAGMISLTTSKALEIPWARSVASASQSGMYFADPALREVKGEFFSASFDPTASEKLFAGSAHRFAHLAALADDSKSLPRFEMNQRLRASLATRHGRVESMNVVARLAGSDPRLAGEHVLFSAHLDHLGIGNPVNGDRIFNGAMDNAAGVAGLLDIARSLKARGVRPKRSLLFLFVTAEEKGLLGSRYFSLRPTVPKESIVADLNFDMYLPIFPLKSVIALGAEESSLGDFAAAVGPAMRLPLVPDPFPDRNAFVRSDQYSFIREGVPSLAFKFGFAKGTREAEAERVWRSTHYHAVSDDLSQTVFREDAVRLHDFVAAIALRVANAPRRPRWRAESFFRRFAED
ncbi:MAG TPA: M28 family metallopeptidase [Allosphingosinicella sp.]|nr:M28 family metallopeptidase [Allosphingosinicella sp.]